MKIVPMANPAQSQPVASNRTIKMNTVSPNNEVALPIAEAQAPEVAGQSAQVETPAEATTQAMSPQHLALARKEKALRKQQLDLQAERDAIKAERESFKAEREKFTSVTQQSFETTDTVDPVQAKIDALEAKINGYETSQTERTTQEYQQALKVIDADAKMLVDSDPAFETIKARGAHGEITKLVEAVFNKEGTILSVEEAAQMIEEKLFETTLKEVEQLSALKKVQAKRQPAAPAAEVPAGKGPAKTLTNAMGVTRQLSARERAILAFNNQLNKS